MNASWPPPVLAAAGLLGTPRPEISLPGAWACAADADVPTEVDEPGEFDRLVGEVIAALVAGSRPGIREEALGAAVWLRADADDAEVQVGAIGPHVGAVDLPGPRLVLLESGDKRLLVVDASDGPRFVRASPDVRLPWADRELVWSDLGDLVRTSHARWSRVPWTGAVADDLAQRQLVVQRRGTLLGVAGTGSPRPLFVDESLGSDGGAVPAEVLYRDAGIERPLFSARARLLARVPVKSIASLGVAPSIEPQKHREGPSAPVPARVVPTTFRGIAVRDVTVQRGGAARLHELSVDFAAGSVTAILGPSGSGKSTLLEALGGRAKLENGRVVLLRGDAAFSIADCQHEVAFVPQAEMVFPDLTVLETVRAACELRLGDVSTETVRARADELVAQVGLAGQAESRVGSPAERVLSGGQVRRLSIAVELAAAPALVLLDEPLSGLSSYDASTVVEQMRRLADSGCAVVAVVHQPSAELFTRFDNVVVVDEGGRLAFAGSSGDCVLWFTRYAHLHGAPLPPPRHFGGGRSPDVILSTLQQRREDDGRRAHSPAFWQQEFAAARADGRAEEPMAVPGSAAGAAAQRRLPALGVLSAVARRECLRRWRSSGARAQAIFVAPLLGGALGWAFRSPPLCFFDPSGTTACTDYSYAANGVMPSLVALSVVVGLFMGVMTTATDLVTDRRLLAHERALGATALGFVVTKWATGALAALLGGIIYSLLAGSIVGLSGGWLGFVGFVGLATAVGSALGIAISGWVRTERAAYALVPLVLVPQMLFAGAFIDFVDLNPAAMGGPVGAADMHARSLDAPPLTAAVSSRWLYEGAMASMAGGENRAIGSAVAVADARLERALSDFAACTGPERDERALGPAGCRRRSSAFLATDRRLLGASLSAPLASLLVLTLHGVVLIAFGTRGALNRR